MLVCHCHVVYAEEIEAEISSGATTTEELAHRCDAGKSCGGCHPALEDLIERMDAAVVRALQVA